MAEWYFPLRGGTTFSLFIHQLMDAWVASPLGLLWITLLRTFIALCEHTFSVLLGTYLGVELLDPILGAPKVHSGFSVTSHGKNWTHFFANSIVTLCLTFWGTVRLHSKVAAPLDVPTGSESGYDSSPSSPNWKVIFHELFYFPYLYGQIFHVLINHQINIQKI